MQAWKHTGNLKQVQAPTGITYVTCYLQMPPTIIGEKPVYFLYNKWWTVLWFQTTTPGLIHVENGQTLTNKYSFFCEEEISMGIMLIEIQQYFI